MRKRFLLWICFSIIVLQASGQEDIKKTILQKYLSFEVGGNTIEPQINEMDFIRSESPSYYNQGEGSSNLTGQAWSAFLGAKAGIASKNNKFRYWAGLRFIHLTSSLGKNSYWSGNPDFFYLLYSNVGTTTEFLKIKEIDQVSEYAGIPLEVNYFPFKPHRFQIGFKIGFELSYRLQTKTEVLFFNSAMNSYEQDIVKMVGDPGPYTASLYGGAKFHYGKPSKMGIGIEVNLPSVFLTREKKGIVSPQAGLGMQLTVQIPLNKTKQ